MADNDPIVVQVSLDTSERNKAFGDIRQSAKSALDDVLKDARRVADQMTKILGSVGQAASVIAAQKQSDADAKRLAQAERHQQRLEQIELKSAAAQVAIEQRKQAQIDVIRERFLASEARRQNQGARSGVSNLLTLSIGVNQFIELGKKAIGVITGLLEAYFNLAKATATVGKEVFDLADKTGVSIRNIDLFRRAALEAGKGLDVVQRSMDQFTSRLERAATSTGVLNRTFRELGVDPVKGIENANAALEQTIKQLNRIENPAVRAAKAQEIFGLRNEAIIPILTRIGESLDAYEKRLGGLGKVTEEQAKAGKSFDVSLNLLNASIAGIAQVLGGILLPVIQSVIDLAQTLLVGLGKLFDMFGIGFVRVNEMSIQIDIFNAALRSTPKWINVVITALGEAINAFGQFTKFIGQSAAAAALFFSGNFTGAAALAGEAKSTASTLISGLGGATKKAFNEAMAETGRQFVELQKERERLSNVGKERLNRIEEGGAAQRKAIRQAELALEKSAAKDALDILKDRVHRELNTLEDAYDRELISTKEFLDNKESLLRVELEAELAMLVAVQKDLEDARVNASGAERLKIQKEINTVLTQQQIKMEAIANLSFKTTQELRKLLGPLKVPDNLPIEEIRERPFQDIFGRSLNVPPIVIQAREHMLDVQKAELGLQIEQQRIQNEVNLGILTEAEGRSRLLEIERALAALRIEQLESEKLFTSNPLKLLELDLKIEQLRTIGVELSNAGRFMKGFGSEVETVGDIFDRFGQNVANSFKNVKTLFDSLKTAVKDFFNDLLGNTLQRLVKGLLGNLFSGGSGASGGSFGALGAILGGAAGGRTAPFNPNSGSGGLGSLIGSILGGGISAGPSSSLIGATTIGGLPTFPNLPVQLSGIPETISQVAKQPGLLAKLLGGLTGGGVVSLLPAILGAGLGAGLGGTSVLGQILGGIGGGAVGLGVAFGASVFGAGGGLGAAALAALGPAALIGAPLLIGAFLLGRAKQRRADEATSGDFLQDAINKIRTLRAQVDSDQIDGSEARRAFETEIISTFIQQINTLKTKSVRESRLAHQVPDLRALFQKEVEPAIALQIVRKRNLADLLPEFAFGGIVGGFDLGRDSVLSWLRPGEMVLTVNHQQKIQRAAGSDIFAWAGVPGAAVSSVGGVPAFLSGGVSRSVSNSSFNPSQINLDVHVGMSKSGAEEIFASGADSQTGDNFFIRARKKANLNRRT